MGDEGSIKLFCDFFIVVGKILMMSKKFIEKDVYMVSFFLEVLILFLILKGVIFCFLIVVGVLIFLVLGMVGVLGRVGLLRID